MLIGHAQPRQMFLDAVGSGRMHHAWLLGGPRGIGKRRFADWAALKLLSGGTGPGETPADDPAAQLVAAGSHPDHRILTPPVEGKGSATESIVIDQVRDLGDFLHSYPAIAGWRTLIVDSIDDMNSNTANAFLKELEEPRQKTVYLLVSHAPARLLPTIRSRCRMLGLSTPSDEAVARLLASRDGIDPALAAHAARAAQGHIGRARALARDDAARIRRHEILSVPGQLVSLGACLAAADNIVKSSQEEAAAATEQLDAREKAELSEALGFGAKGARPRNAQAALKDLEDQQKARAKRVQRDALDRVLTELTTFYRDVLIEQTLGRAGEDRLINPELRSSIQAVARSATPEQVLRRIDAILQTRVALEGNVTPLLAIESLFIRLADL